jgi:DNA-binding XRE family transcriptional regulator
MLNTCIHALDHHNNHRDKHAEANNVIFTIPYTAPDYSNLPETTLAERVKKYRLLNDITQRQLADKIGVHKETIYNIEHGRTKGSPKIAKFMSSI